MSILADIRAGGVTLQKKHVLQFFEKVEQTNPQNPQQLKGTCMCCLRSVPSTGSFKMVHHLVKCPLCPREIKEAFGKLCEASVAKSAAKREADSLATEEAQLAQQDHERRQSMLKQQCIRAGIKESEVAAADLAIAMFFYANAIPFAAANTDEDSLYRKMVSAIQAAPAGYVPPTRNKLAGELLDAGYI